MAFTTDELLKLGLTEEQAKEVFALRGKELNADKSALGTITKERDSLKDQLQKAEEQVENLKSLESISADQKEAIDKLQADYDKYKQEAEAELAKTNKVNAINLALKDTKAHNPAALMKFIDVDAIEFDDNGKPKLDEVINGLKKVILIFSKQMKANQIQQLYPVAIRLLVQTTQKQHSKQLWD